ncbi:hypothetical protein [Myroides sp. WP-1]|uniref:hypothetical protein n=1 Tax=Myroides sp. WP-1 TaxID=2759944 RepID=UPI0015FAF562|nr:hypothetical protein [Myroides sp. WP-1]MBB1140664.1 hypothetical protein [Myroides sp. WP-1]
MKILNDVISYRISNSFIRINAGVDIKSDSRYIVINYHQDNIEETKVFEDFFHFTDDVNYLLFGIDSKVYRIKKNEFLDVKSYSITNDYGIVSNSERLYNLYNFTQKKITLRQWLPNRIFHVQAQYWVNDTEADFKLIDVNKGEIVWTIPQPEVEKPYGYTGLTNIKKVLGIYKDCLWLQLPDSRLWKLDLHTGRVLEELEAFYFASIPEGIFLYQQGIIFILHYNIYAQYSLEQGIFTIDKQITNENELIIRYVLFKEKDNYLYFTGNKDQSFSPNVYGIFDMETETIVFQGEMIEEGGYFYEIPQVNDELFTILDAKGNLIIHRLDDLL